MKKHWETQNVKLLYRKCINSNGLLEKFVVPLQTVT